VAPWNLSLYDTAGAHLAGAPLPFAPISLAPRATWREAVKLGAVAAFLLVCYNTYRTRSQVRRAIWTMIVMGALLSLFGIVQRMTWNGRLYWVGPEAPHRQAWPSSSSRWP
jgi:hypothetical protein